MPKYIVSATATVTYTMEVNAGSERDAFRKGQALENDLDLWEEEEVLDFHVSDANLKANQEDEDEIDFDGETYTG